MSGCLTNIIGTVIAISFWGGLFYGLYTTYPEELNILFFITLIVIVLTILAKISRSFSEQKAMKSYVKEESLKKAADKLREKAEREKLEHFRDSDNQSSPYIYQIGNHANESLAIRYGIANMERNEPAKHIRLQKIRKIEKDKYEVLLIGYRGRKSIAVIEVGTEYVKTFYPLNDNWFEKHEALETALKGNGSFTLKELATFHVQKTVG